MHQCLDQDRPDVYLSPQRHSCHKMYYCTTSLGQEQDHSAAQGCCRGHMPNPILPMVVPSSLARDRGYQLSGLRWGGETQWGLGCQE